MAMIGRIAKLFNRIRAGIARKGFLRGSVMGRGVTIFATAACKNRGRREAIVIGEHSEIKGILRVEGNGQIRLGHHVYLGAHSSMEIAKSLVVGDCAIISNHVSIFDNNNHPTDPEARRRMSMAGSDSPLWNITESVVSPVTIESNVWIGQYAAILKGVTVGEGSIVGMHSVVTRDVPPFSVVAGNPARVVKMLK
jgi:maltose O-acetyltransferase